MISWYQSGDAASEPVLLAEAKAHCHVYHDGDDDFLTALIVAARELGEAKTWRQFVSAEWTLVADAFPDAPWFQLPRAPLSGVDSITYLDGDGATQTLSADNYVVLSGRKRFGQVWLKDGQTWPVTYPQVDAVTVTFTAGYGAAADVPQLAKQAILMRVANWYLNREPTVEATVAQVYEGPKWIDKLLAVRGELNGHCSWKQVG